MNTGARQRGSSLAVCAHARTLNSPPFLDLQQHRRCNRQRRHRRCRQRCRCQRCHRQRHCRKFYFYLFYLFFWGGDGPPHFFRHFSSSLTLISAQNFVHDPRTTPSGRKVRESERREKREEERREKVTEYSGHYISASHRV
jgi:hypothetical protein